MDKVNTNTVTPYQWGEQSLGWHLHRSARLSVIEERVPPGDREVRHLHKKAQQFFYVLEGIATLEVDGREHQLHAGDGLSVPANTPHQLVNKSETDVRFLVISEPASHGDRVVVG